MKWRKGVSVLVLSLLLISCGGGGGGTAASTNASSLVGTWTGNWSNSPTQTDTMTYTANTVIASSDANACVVTWSYTANAGSITLTVASYNDATLCNNSNGAVGTAYTGTYSISGNTLTTPFNVSGATYTFTGTKSTSTANMAGTWIGSVSYTNASGESVTLNPMTFIMTQSGTSVTGTWTFAGLGSTKTMSGTVNNSILAATMADTACTLNSGSITADLTLNGNKLVATSFAAGSKVCNSATQDSAVTAFSGSLTKQ